MSVESIAAVLNHSKASGNALVILLGIANHDGDGGSFPALGTLARYANISLDRARKNVRQLEALGELRVVINGGGTDGSDGKPRTPDHMKPNRYHVLVDCPPEPFCDHSKSHRRLCDVCNDPVPNERRSEGRHKDGMCCPTSGALGRRFGTPCPTTRGYHSPDACGYSEADDS